LVYNAVVSLRAALVPAPKGDAREVTVEVRNEHRQRVLTITVSMQVERVEPPPQLPRT
jgi:hypothetical protein